jgi:hypothetical protein
MKKIIIIAIIGIFLGAAISPAVTSVNIKNTAKIIEENKDEAQIKSADGTTEYWAIVAGCGRYDDPSANLPVGFLQQRYLFYSLLAQKNWDRKYIIGLFNDFTDLDQPLKYAGGATKANLLKAFDEMATKVDADDVFLFAWQGHGSQVPDDNGDEKTFLKPFDKYDEVICPFDCYRDDDDILHNFIRDDELEAKFSAIGGKGQCLIFESCFSGGLISKSSLGDGENGALDANGNNIIDPDEAEAFTQDFESDLEGPDEKDVNGPGRVVIMASLDDHVARLTYLFGGPLTTGMALGLLGQFRGKLKDRNNDGYLSAEEAFRWAQPRVMGMVSSMYVGMWLYFIATAYFLNDDSETQLIDAIIKGSIGFFAEFAYMQILMRLMAGVWAGTFPHMNDKYTELGGLDLIQLKGTTQENVLSTLSLPNELFSFEPTEQSWNNIFNYLKTETPLGDWEDSEIAEWLPPVEDYTQVRWSDNHPSFMPEMFAEIEDTYSAEEEETIEFSAAVLGGTEPYDIVWDFGDGTTGTGLNPTHTYQEEGTYTVSLTVTDDDGEIAKDMYNYQSIPKITVEIDEKASRYRSLIINRFCENFPILTKLLSLF